MDFAADGKPFENPENVADQAYSSIAPSFSEAVGAEFGGGPIAALSRAAERGTQAGASWFDRALLQSGEANSDLPIDEPTVTPTISAAEANARYAPAGTTITDKPMPEGLAQIVGRQKQAEVQRDSVIARYQNVHSWPANFGTGLASFVLDPLNDASMFIPGLGEESLLGGLSRTALGTGIVARTIARAGAGATAGAIGQIPLSGLRYGLGTEESSDYGIRDAARDVAFGAAGGAIFSAGLGLGLHETGILGKDGALHAADELRPQPGPTPAEVAPILNADAGTNHAAMSAAVSQMLDGRPVDVLPIFDAKDFDSVTRLAAMRDEHAELGERIGALPAGDPAAADRLTRLQAVESDLKGENLGSEARKALLTRRDELLTDTTPEALQAAAAPVAERQRLTTMQARTSDEINRLEAVRQSQATATALSPGQSGPLRISPSQLAETQAALYRSGYAPGISADDLAQTKEQIYGQRAASQQTPAAPSQTVPGKKALTPEESNLADLESRWQARAPEATGLSPDEHQELVTTQDAVTAAQQKEQGYTQASACLNEAGI